ncbi:MAG: hypothetical protein U1G07_26710 [Verrucomicrobiota bacterium]
MNTLLFRFLQVHQWILTFAVLSFATLPGTAQLTNSLCEGFEASTDDWFADNGTWEFGVPTSGPGTAHGGTQCVATVLAGDYRENTTSRLQGPRFLVPEASANPHLRFWHWFSFNCGDYGEVQIKVGNGDWQSLTNAPAIFTGYSGGVWSNASLDLNLYAGKRVQLGFYFSSTSVNCGGTVAPGWYIDDVCIQTGFVEPLIVNQVESFEGAGFWSNWSTDRGTWEWGVPTSGPGLSHDGTNVIATVLAGDYGENTSSLLVSPPVTVPAADQHPRLRFWHWYNFNCGDRGQVQVRVGSNDWQTLATYDGYSGGIWTYAALDLSPYAGKTLQLGFSFSSTSINCGGTIAPGWYLDELVIVTGETVLANPMDFEASDFWSNWSSDGGTWEWGSPASGPGAAHQGTNCIATVLNDNYGENTASRLVSPRIVLPPAGTNPRLRFWHWFDFNCGDGGMVQVRIGTNDWETLNQGSYVGNGGGVWGQPSLSLSRYAGQTVQLGFYFYSSSVNCGGTIAPGWYLDELRLLSDPALVLDSVVVRTQTTACVALKLATSTPATSLSFRLQLPAGPLGQVALSTVGHWTNATLTPQGDSEWLGSVQNTAASTSMGMETVGFLCFSSSAAESVFVPLGLKDVIVSGNQGSTSVALALGGRAVIVAGRPLLEAWLSADGERMATLYGLAGRTYGILNSEGVTPPATWTPRSTHPIAEALSASFPLQDEGSTAPFLFLRAQEQ